jgi:hypothetical protein
MAKSPKDLPKVGDRCKLRGRDAVGTVQVISERNWTYVTWDENVKAPLICHLHELESNG